MRGIQGCGHISYKALLIYLFLISHGNEEARAFSVPHSLTKSIFLSTLLVLRAVLHFSSAMLNPMLLSSLPVNPDCSGGSPFLTFHGCQPSPTTGHSY